MSFVGIVFFTMAAAFIGLQLKRHGEYGIYVMLVAGIFLFFSVLSGIQRILEGIRVIQGYIGLEENYLTLIIKMIGISYLTQFASDICKDCGYQTLSNQLQVFGKVSVLAVSMPVVLTVMEVINEMLGDAL